MVWATEETIRRIVWLVVVLVVHIVVHGFGFDEVVKAVQIFSRRRNNISPQLGRTDIFSLLRTVVSMRVRLIILMKGLNLRPLP